MMRKILWTNIGLIVTLIITFFTYVHKMDVRISVVETVLEHHIQEARNARRNS